VLSGKPAPPDTPRQFADALLRRGPSRAVPGRKEDALGRLNPVTCGTQSEPGVDRFTLER
jgi:hypothetical protein